jgi:hypothetical protein
MDQNFAHKENKNSSDLKKLLFLFLLQVPSIIIAQTICDNINRDEIFIIKSDSQVNRSKLLSFKNLTLNDVAKYFGENYRIKRAYADLFEVNYSKVEFDDGLIFNFPDSPKMDKAFRVTTDKYTLLLNTGEKIKVGMKAQELNKIFPKSYSQKMIINGKLSIIVYFSFILEGKLCIESSWIAFILTKEDGVLKEFFTWEAG